MLFRSHQKRDTLTYFKEAGSEELRDLFTIAAKGSFNIMHAIIDGDPVQHTNSKIPHMHIHSFRGPFAEDYQHITDPEIKSYVMRPNPAIGDIILGMENTGKLSHITIDKEDGGEAAVHSIIRHPAYVDFADFSNPQKAERALLLMNRPLHQGALLPISWREKIWIAMQI